MKSIVLIISITALLLLGREASGAVQVYTFPLSADQEVPANPSAATGTCTVKLDDVTGSVEVTGSYQGLTSATVASHIHGLAAAGTNAPVIVPLTHTGGTAGNLSGTGTLSAGQIQGMLDGRTYVNVHTVNYPGGEIRGQVVKTAATPAMHFWGMTLLMTALLGAGVLILRRRRTAVAQ